MDVRLARLLADGRFHSGEALGATMGISRAAIWNRIAELREAGVTIYSVPGKGYMVPGGIDLLDEAAVRAWLTDAQAATLDLLRVVDIAPSTNDLALSGLKDERFARAAIFAEQQTAGRGRRGRAWSSPFATNIYLSVAWEFPGGLSAIDGLSLAIGVAVCDAVRAMGVREAGLKWPNDLVVHAKKLGGILIEINGDISGSCAVVVGVGLNVAMPDTVGAVIDQPWTDMRAEGGVSVRNEVAGRVLSHILDALGEFSRQGFVPYLSRWRQYDVMSGRHIHVAVGPLVVAGIAAGIDDKGALVVETPEGRRIFHGGEVSLRRGDETPA